MKIKNCVYNGPPKPLNSTGVEVLRDHCPHLVNGDQTLTCCDNEQINDLAKKVQMAANLLQRCPSCYTNFLQIICEFTCSPKQSTFLDVKKINKSEKSQSKNLIANLSMYNLMINFILYHL